eukprot:760460-Hanusia_phi.AAC.4
MALAPAAAYHQSAVLQARLGCLQVRRLLRDHDCKVLHRAILRGRSRWRNDCNLPEQPRGSEPVNASFLTSREQRGTDLGAGAQRPKPRDVTSPRRPCPRTYSSITSPSSSYYGPGGANAGSFPHDARGVSFIAQHKGRRTSMQDAKPIYMFACYRCVQPLRRSNRSWADVQQSKKRKSTGHTPWFRRSQQHRSAEQVAYSAWQGERKGVRREKGKQDGTKDGVSDKRCWGGETTSTRQEVKSRRRRR